MKIKVIALYLMLFAISSCGEKKELVYPIDKLRLENMATYYFNGTKGPIIISDNESIKYINNKIKALTNDKSDSIQTNVNYGFVEIDIINDKGDVNDYFYVIFTQSHGDIIRYGGKHYYYDQELVDFIKEKLKMAENPMER